MGVGVAEAGSRVWVGTGEAVKVNVGGNGWKGVNVADLDSRLALSVGELIPLSVVGALQPAKSNAIKSSNASAYGFVTNLIETLINQ